MLTVISPAKRLDWAARDIAMTEPRFAADARMRGGWPGWRGV